MLSKLHGTNEVLTDIQPRDQHRSFHLLPGQGVAQRGLLSGRSWLRVRKLFNNLCLFGEGQMLHLHDLLEIPPEAGAFRLLREQSLDTLEELQDIKLPRIFSRAGFRKGFIWVILPKRQILLLDSEQRAGENLLENRATDYAVWFVEASVFFVPSRNFSQSPHFREALSKHLSCQFRFLVLHSDNSSLSQYTIFGNACYHEIFIVTVS